jgi:cytochrome c-type biogenesis protein CcsB
MIDSYFFMATFVCSLFAAVFYFILLIHKDSAAVARLAIAFTAVAGVANTAGVVLRWKDIGRFPISTLTEMLFCLSWCLIAGDLLLEALGKMRSVGTLLLPLAAFAVGITILMPDTRMGNLPAALQSNWLPIHVSLAIISYAACGVSFCVAILYLLKIRVPLESFGIWIALGIAAVFALIDGGGIFRTGAYHMTRMVEFRDEIEGITRLVPARDEPRRLLIPYAGTFFLFVAAVFLLALLFLLIHRLTASGWAREAGNLMFFVGCPLQWVSIGALLYGIRLTREAGSAGISLKSNNFEVTLIFLAALASSFYVLFHRFLPRILGSLPDEKTLDNLCYKVITFAFPLLTLVIITGAAWAHRAWGRYWGWDPKETWSLITWFVYLGYLHARITLGWSGKRAAYLALIGFIFVLITFLGVSYIPMISEGSLHTYA